MINPCLIYPHDISLVRPPSRTGAVAASLPGLRRRGPALNERRGVVRTTRNNDEHENKNKNGSDNKTKNKKKHNDKNKNNKNKNNDADNKDDDNNKNNDDDDDDDNDAMCC